VICPSCGHDNLDDARFCELCAAELGCVCAACATANQAGARFCRSCRAPLAPPESATPSEPQAPVSTAAPAPSSFSGGRYQVKRFLGEGARKRAYLVHDNRLDREVAIAVIKTDGLDADGLARVQREAQAMGRLGDHPHIVTVYDIGEEEGAGGQAHPFIVSEYMSGGDLEALLRQAPGHRLSLDEAVRIANEVRQALEHAHSRSIVHRDLKPGNIWLTEDGHARLGDFGLALALDRSRLTMEGMMVGTVAYMAPEQALGRQPDARSDLYSLGCVLYEMLTGRPPFLGDDAVAVISQHINTAPVAPSWHNPEVPRALEALIMRLLAKDPADRPESAASIPEALATIAQAGAGVAGQAIEEEANPLDRLAGGVFVGREKEMDELRAGLEEALSGRGRLLMLVGEPGIGKTRTSEELATYAGLRRAQVLWGRCYEGEGAPAYWPWVQIIRSYVHDRDPDELKSQMGPGAADIAQVVSEVSERLPGLPSPPDLEPEQARFRLFDSITAFLRNASSHEPLVLVLDDLHWADKPSLLLLQFLAREMRGARLLVLGTYRDIELGRQHPLAQTLGELNREGLSQRILLRGLTDRDVARFIELTAGAAPPAPLVEAVYRETEGNPFFVNEVVRLLVSDGRLERPEDVKSWSVTVPQSVREVVGRRLDRLSDDCNSVLAIASVIGREFQLEALERLSEVKGDRLLEVLEEAVASKVAVEVPRLAGRYTFGHALIRETLYEELSTTRRLRLHRQVAEALEDLYGADPEPHLAELAYHFAEAANAGGDPEKAIDYSVRAGARAAQQRAYEDAIAHYERALQTLESTGAGADRTAGLLLELGEARWATGEFLEARATLLKAAEIAKEADLPNVMAEAALGYQGRVVAFNAGVVDEVAISLFEHALARLGDSDDPLRARVLAGLASALAFSAPMERRESLCQEAVEIARRHGDQLVLAAVLLDRHWALWSPDNLEERLEMTAEMQRLAAATGSKGITLAGAWLLWDLLEQGEMRAWDEESVALAAAAEESRQPYYLWIAEIGRAGRHHMLGEFEEAERVSQRALAVGQEAQNRNAVQIFGAQMGLVRREQGRLAEMEPAVTGIATQVSGIPAWRCGLAWLYAELGRQEEARAAFESFAKDGFAALPRDMAWLLGTVLLADVCVKLDDRERAAVLYDSLLPFADRCASFASIFVGPVSRFLGMLATTLERWPEAEAHFQRALAMCERMGTRPWEAWTQHGYAEMLLARGERGDRTKAVELLNAALDTGHELGMKTLVDRALAAKLKVAGIDTSDLRTSIEAVAASVYVDKPDMRSHAAPDGTVTIMFSDIEGSTAMTERLGDQRWMEVLREHNAIVREQLADHGGFEVKSEGDGFMLAFQSARQAVQCALDIQQALALRNQSAEEPLRVRMGLHTGEVIKEGDDFFGRNVILAARIAAQAQGGQVLVSSLVKGATESAGDFAFAEGRDLELKGLAERQTVFEVEWVPGGAIPEPEGAA
jgi:class 3 adenylate cyclase